MITRFVAVAAAVLGWTGLLLPTAPSASASTSAASVSAAFASASASAYAPASVFAAEHADIRTSPRVFQGAGFDACQAPDPATMEAWRRHSAYRAVGIYFGGRSRACAKQTYLTADWVRRTDADGWHLLPVYAGSQSPCAGGGRANPHPIDSARPAGQGAEEAADAVERARALAIAPGSPLYLDMEAYDTGKARCARTTLAFIRAWDERVTRAGYLAGFYSSADSGAADLERARERGMTHLPDVLWYARWGAAAGVTREPVLAEGAWSPHERVHQYAGAVTETHGGRQLTVDRDLVDAPVAVIR